MDLQSSKSREVVENIHATPMNSVQACLHCVCRMLALAALGDSLCAHSKRRV